MSRLSPLVGQQELADAWRILTDRLRYGGRPIRRTLGWQGGSGLCTLYWHAQQALWAELSIHLESKRYICSLGTDDPASDSPINIVSQINVPMVGVNRRCAGAIMRDEQDRLLLTHSGNVGGGRAGINKDGFVASYTGGQVASVRWPDGKSTDVFIVGQIDGFEFPAHVAQFTQAVNHYKRTARSA
jgi:hypothetical protein